MIQENRNKDDCSTAASRSSFSDSYNHSSIDQPRASFMRRNSKRKKSLCGPIDSLTEIEIPQINGIRYAQGPNGEVEDKVNQEEPIIINSPYSCKGFHQTMPKVERPLDEISESEDLRGKGHFVWIPSTSSENVCSKCGHLQENGNSPPTPTETRIHLMKGATVLSKCWDILYSIIRCIFLCLVLILGFLLYRIWCASCWSVRNVVHYAAQDRPFAVLRSRTSTLFEWIKRFTRSEKKDSRQGQTYDDADTTHKDVMLQNKDNDSDSVLGVPSDDSNDDNRKHKEKRKDYDRETAWKRGEEERTAFDEIDGRRLLSGKGIEDGNLAQLPSDVVKSLMSDSCSPEEIVVQLKESLHLGEKCLEQPNPETKRTIRCLAKRANDLNRIDVVKHLRKITPAGITGPLLPWNLDIRNIPHSQMRELTIDLSGGEKWKYVAEKLRLSRKEIRYFDERFNNPCDAALASISQRRHITVGDLYDVLTECGYPVLADTL